MGGYLFFGAVVVDWALLFLEFDRAGSIPREFDLHVVQRVIDAARCGDRSFMAILVMARKVVLLSVRSQMNYVQSLSVYKLSVGRRRDVQHPG